MAIIKQYHRDTDTTYVYESISYWDAEKQQSRSKRRVIGKIDPETGEVVPTGKRGRKKSSAGKAETFQGNETTLQLRDGELLSQLHQQQIEISSLKTSLSALEAEKRRLRALLEKTSAMAEKISAICNSSDSI